MGDTNNVIMNPLIDIIKTKNLYEFKQAVRKIDQNIFDVNMQNEFGNTLLHIACRCRNHDIVTYLVDNLSANINIKNIDGRTPVHLAAIYGASDKSYYITNTDISRNKITNASDILNMLLNKNFNSIYIRDNDGMTPFDYYIIHSKYAMVDIMKKKYKNYKRVMFFFETIKKSNMSSEDYNLTISIFFALRT